MLLHLRSKNGPWTAPAPLACCLVLAVGLLAPASVSAQERKSSWLVDQSLMVGNYIGTSEKMPSAAACRDACLQNPKCVSWGFNTPKGATEYSRNRCFLHSLRTSNTTVPTQGVISGIVDERIMGAITWTPQPAEQSTAPAAASNPEQSQIASAPHSSEPVVAPAPVTSLPVTPSRRVALVVGNGGYRFATTLNNPANDATDVSAALRRLGFDVVEGRDLDRPAMDDIIREFGRKLDRADLALFFYAGHGLQVGGKNYLLPIDAKLERAGDLALDAVDVSVVLAQMEAEKRVNLVFLDACRDNPLTRSLARSLGTRSGSVGTGLASIQSAIGTMIAYATQPDNVALDGDGRNSPFTAALLKHIATAGADIGSVMRRVRADVVAATREKQVPWDHSSLMGDVVLAR